MEADLTWMIYWGAEYYLNDKIKYCYHSVRECNLHYHPSPAASSSIFPLVGWFQPSHQTKKSTHKRDLLELQKHHQRLSSEPSPLSQGFLPLHEGLPINPCMAPLNPFPQGRISTLTPSSTYLQLRDPQQILLRPSSSPDRTKACWV